MASLSLETQSLSKSYGKFTALSNLNLKIEGSKCVGFLGPNGAGKTTTLKIMTTLISPTSGTVLINGVDVRKEKRRALEPAGALVETPEIYPSLTPREAMRMVSDIRGIPRSEQQSRIEDAIAEVKMQDWLDEKVGKFSKGMKQRVNVAAALLGDPQVVLLDEPTTGLDPRGMSEVRDIVKSLKSKQRLVFMSSHLLAEVTDVCDEVAMIDHGKLLVYDTIANVTSRFSGGENAVEVEFAGQLPDEPTMGKILALPGVTSFSRLDNRRIRLNFEGGESSQQRLLSEMVSMNLGVMSFAKGSSALEDAYLNLIKETVH